MPKKDIKINKNLERDVKRAAEKALREEVAKLQKMLDSLVKKYEGHPVNEIKPVLSKEWSKIGGSITEPDLTQFSEQISAGTRIELSTKKL